MTRVFTRVGLRLPIAVCFLPLWGAAQARAEFPSPVLHTVFPAGGQAGTSVTVAVDGTGLDGLRDLHSTVPRLTAKKTGTNRFSLTIPAGAPAGVYDLRAVGLYGMSSPRAFVVGNRAETLEREANDTFASAQPVPLDVVVNGRIEKPGDVDCYKFRAKAGQRVVLECLAERIDSPLRAVLEVHDATGKRLAVNRGYTGIDPLVDFLVPADGTYFVKVFDLSYLGSAAHYYRLDIDTKPRLEFALPCVVTRGRSTRVKLFGRNLFPPSPRSRKAESSLALDCVDVEITPPAADRHEPIPLPLRPAQVTVDAFPYYYPGSHAPLLVSVTDVPVLSGASDNTVPDHAQALGVPCEVSGQLTDGDERHWYAVRARRGEVLWLEAFGARIGSPVDLDLTVLDPSGRKELVKLADSLEDLGGYRFPTAHPDPAGRWVVPADGRYLILVRNLIGGQNRDPRRIYRLSVRREEPDFHLAVISRRADQPAGLNLWRGGREMVEVLALRRRGLSGPIRVAAEKLPTGIQCPDIWIGPGQDHGVVVLSANRECPSFAGGLNLVGHADLGGTEITRPARGGTMTWPGQPTPSGRLTQEVPLATAPEANLLLTASPGEAVVYQESVLDVAVDVEQRFEGPAAPLQLTGVGLPRLATNTIATIPAGKNKGWLSFFFPASLPPGPYTFAVQGETVVPVGSGSRGGSPGKVGVTLVTNPITVLVRPARIVLEVDPRTPRKIGRGKIIQLRFTTERKHGFIGKVHTELVAPGGVVGLRGRGVTLVGQSDSGTLQVIATENAPLGRHPFLRLEAVGTVEDQPVYRASRFVELEITE
ncbi:MAG: PPC domain-containing protein [Planctomycetes bacterium]|nr:PPC domain-containing protein [Planctomycetota bacterium]